MTDLDRRSLLVSLGAAGIAAVLPGCAPRVSAPPTGPLVVPPRLRRLARVQVSPARVIREVAGLRPFRSSGFRVEAERLGDRLLVHNYGHGGGGVSLSWGSASLAVELALASEARRAAVLGAGAVGLATARLLQDQGFEVTLYA